MNKIIWLTGSSGSGKTTIAKALQKEWDAIILDGDEMRDSISLGIGFSKEDRTKHNFRVARLANILSQQTNIIVSVIAPIEEVRKEITNLCNPIWIYVKRTIPKKEGHFYEISIEYPVIDSDKMTVEEEKNFVLDYCI